MLTIESASLEDAAIITSIKIKAFNKEINTYLGRNGGPPGYDDIDSERYIITHFIAKKILLHNTIIGAFFLILINETTMRFEDFVIAPTYQGRGYGQQILSKLPLLYPDIQEWQLSTPVFSIGNQHLYEKLGFHEVSRTDEEIEYKKIILNPPKY